MLCLVCASHNGVSESEVLDLFPELELPVLSTLLYRLNRLCVVTLRCGLIRFQHLQVTGLRPGRIIRPKVISNTKCIKNHDILFEVRLSFRLGKL